MAEENHRSRIIFIYLLFLISVSAYMEADGCQNVTMVTRQEWGARPTKSNDHMNTPVTTLFIHHTAMRECSSLQECSEEMRIIQNFHMDDRGK